MLAGIAGSVMLAVAIAPTEELITGALSPLNLDALLEARSPGGRPAGALTQTKFVGGGPVGGGEDPSGPRQRVLPVLRDRGGPVGSGPVTGGLPELGLPLAGLDPLLGGPPLGGGDPGLGGVPNGPGFFGPGFVLPGGGGGGGGGGGIVPTPTPTPTDTPTPVPSPTPTATPTAVPTGTPSPEPTPPPTAVPTGTPTPEPTPTDPIEPPPPPPPVTPVPEPGTWLMMIAGVGLIGGALRRKRLHGPARPADR